MRRPPSRLAGFRAVAPFILIMAIAAFVQWPGLTAPFWLDDSWTANSVREPTLRGMLRYDGWMQVTPPLFLFALRWGVSWAEPDWVWRLLPWSGTILAAALLYRLLRRELGLGWAMAGSTLYLFSESVMKQASAIKSFSWETAIGVFLLTASLEAFRRPSRRAIVRVCLIACLLSVSGYSAPPQVAAATILVLWGLWLRRKRPGARQLFGLLACGVLVSGLVFAVVYLTMMRPNIDSSLAEFWFKPERTSLQTRVATFMNLMPGSIIVRTAPLAVAMCLVLAAPVYLLAFLKARTRHWMRYGFAAAGWILLAVAIAGETTQTVPISPRGGVYLTPWWTAALLGTFRMGWRLGGKPASPAALRALGYSALCLILAGAIAAAIVHHRDPGQPPEDFRAIVKDLKDELTPRDRVVVHATTIEQFKYYSRMAGFPSHQVVTGNTAWPCCIKNRKPFILGSEEILGDTALPDGLPRPERIFLTVLTYGWHWIDCRGNEIPRWESALRQRGCLLAGARHYGAADLLSFDCK